MTENSMQNHFHITKMSLSKKFRLERLRTPRTWNGFVRFLSLSDYGSATAYKKWLKTPFLIQFIGYIFSKYIA
jgi:hypothetical protein